MNEQQLQEIKERVAKATQGKWFIDNDGDISDARGSNIAFSKLSTLHTPIIYWDGVEDKIFVSNAVNDVQALLAEVERLQEKVSNQVKFLEQNVIGFKRKNKFIDKLRSSLYRKNENLKEVQMEVHRLRKINKKLRKEKNIERL